MSNSTPAVKKRIEILDALRALACVSVCLYHFGLGSAALKVDGLPGAILGVGWRGVEIFFVISGFVIPYSLGAAGYSVRDFVRFVCKRILRLDPPYLAAICVVILAAYISNLIPGFRGAPFNFSKLQLLLHFGYLNAFFNYPWLNPAFWTLAVEFQFYLLIGIVFPLVSSPKAHLRILLFVSFGGLAIVFPSSTLLFNYLFLFMLGILAFQLHSGLIGRKWFLIGLIVFGSGIMLTQDLATSGLGILTASCIAFLTLRHSIFRFLGGISYSLYLLHVPIGGRVVNLCGRFVQGNGMKLGVVALALAISIGASYMLYLLVELPSQRWSSRIRYRSESETASFLANDANRTQLGSLPQPNKRSRSWKNTEATLSAARDYTSANRSEFSRIE